MLGRNFFWMSIVLIFCYMGIEGKDFILISIKVPYTFFMIAP